MRFLHTADWHIGRRLHGFDLTESQADAFTQIETIAKAEKVDGILLAGDLYDRGLPSESSVEQLNAMIEQLNLTDQIPIYAISGNHDSAIRIATGAQWFKATKFYMATDIKDAFDPITVGDTQIFLLPYFEPFAAAQYFDDESIVHLDQAVAAAVAKMKTLFDPDKKHILEAHFFVSGSTTTDSETQLTVGGLASVPLETLKDFDYVALGHLHGRQALQADNASYSGSPVKFSLSEATQEKGVYILDTETMTREFKPLTPLRDVQLLHESFETLIDPIFYNGLDLDNYYGITLTDTKPIPNVLARLREIYPNIITLEREKGYQASLRPSALNVKHQDPMALLEQFYELVAKDDLSDQQKQWAEDALKKANKEVQP
ncbi:exonuclease SbcCD subunit D [Secundilactobacillus paracollinoides]|uniref:exonuclease SbcCD subunit D n=1 Tax=Secundilactobacillus paracollinoides TaxID=240427 RepID=UPI0006F10D7B|nr:exonuclease SbcCD subunit D [Secundilactobacillus paracollinoides]KRL76541.1 exonuclease SbcD [Secundilactobacillus paracollinoides DSM 15502 = JCM 11969]